MNYSSKIYSTYTCNGIYERGKVYGKKWRQLRYEDRLKIYAWMLLKESMVKDYLEMYLKRLR